jgi:hypothetical protein
LKIEKSYLEKLRKLTDTSGGESTNPAAREYFIGGHERGRGIEHAKLYENQKRGVNTLLRNLSILVRNPLDTRHSILPYDDEDSAN